MVILWVNIRVRPPPSWNSVFGTTWLRFSSRSRFRARVRNLVGPGPDTIILVYRFSPKNHPNWTAINTLEAFAQFNAIQLSVQWYACMHALWSLVMHASMPVTHQWAGFPKGLCRALVQSRARTKTYQLLPLASIYGHLRTGIINAHPTLEYVKSQTSKHHNLTHHIKFALFPLGLVTKLEVVVVGCVCGALDHRSSLTY